MEEVRNDWDSIEDHFFSGRYTNSEIVDFWNEIFPDQLILENNRETLLSLDKKQLVTMMLTSRYEPGYTYIRFENENAYSLSLQDLYDYVSKDEFITYVLEKPSKVGIKLV
jgi:hypothetical protein